MKVRGSEIIFPINSLFRSKDEVEQLLLLARMEDAGAFVKSVGFGFAVYFSPVSDKFMMLQNKEEQRLYENDDNGQILNFYRNRDYVKNYAMLCFYINQLTMQNYTSIVMPLELYTILYDIHGANHTLRCDAVSKWMMDNFMLLKKAVDYQSSKTFFIFASKYLSGSRWESSSKMEAALNLDLSTFKGSKRGTLWPKAEEASVFFDCLIDFVEHISHNYTAEASTSKNVLSRVDGLKITALNTITRFMGWMKENNDDDQYELVNTFNTKRKNITRPSFLGSYLIWNLLLRRMSAEVMWEDPTQALRLCLKGRPKKKLCN